MVWGFWLRVWGSGVFAFRQFRLGFRVSGVGFRVQVEADLSGLFSRGGSGGIHCRADL